MDRASLHLSINGKAHEVAGDDAFLSLSDFLRLRLGLIGTKIVCSEGDCGACTVLVARSGGHDGRYAPVDACITFMFQLDGASVVTVEGLRDGDEPHAVQRAMVEGHGSQCGFCTPGFVMAMAALADEVKCNARGAMSEGELLRGLTGNLCRCTGYSQIIEAGRRVAVANCASLAERFPLMELPEDEQNEQRADPNILITSSDGRELFVPRSSTQAVKYLARSPDAKIIAGATDLGVQINKGLISPRKVLYIGGLFELKRISISADSITLGAAATWWDIAQAVKKRLPQLVDILERFGAPQIRHAATIGGNVINASPIADSLPLLYVTDATLHVASVSGSRRVKMADFIRGYKKLDLLAGELLTSISFTPPAKNQPLLLYKVSKRRDLDISTFTAAMLFTMTGSRIEEARIAYGGVGPVVLRLPRTEAFLRGKSLTESLMVDAGALARSEIAPITDVRASSGYRSELAETILLKAYHELTGNHVFSG